MIQHNLIARVASVAVFLALLVVMLGAYTRLTDAGLGCPDWPGCYGRLILPNTQEQLKEAQTSFPQIPLESSKAWTEMVHRYAAGTLGLLILFIGLSTIRQRMQGYVTPWFLPMLLLVLVLFQAALGMWTVTLKLLPIVVMGHLLGGIVLFACLSRFRLQISTLAGQDLPQWRPWLRLAVIIVFLQIALGGWLSSNYAGISCIGFPQCNGVWLPDLHFAAGFKVLSSIGANYQGGLLSNEARVTIHWVHRMGAVVTACYLLILSALILGRSRAQYLRRAAGLIAALVLLQFILGVLNVIYFLPLAVAVAHNGVAALLLATTLGTLHFTSGRQKNGR